MVFCFFRNIKSLYFTYSHSYSLVLSPAVIHSLSFLLLVVIRCHSLSLVVIRWYLLYHSLSLSFIRCTTRSHSLSLVVIFCYSMYHSFVFLKSDLKSTEMTFFSIYFCLDQKMCFPVNIKQFFRTTLVASVNVISTINLFFLNYFWLLIKSSAFRNY